ncbi:hypothetical protein ACTVAI_02865 [Jeotgalibaca sp. A127]
MTRVEVQNEKELLAGLERREETLVVKGELRQKVRDLLKTKLSDEELMGFELGSAGTGGIVAEIVYWVISRFSKDSVMQKDLEAAIRQYNAKVDADNNLILYLRQLDY